MSASTPYQRKVEVQLEYLYLIDMDYLRFYLSHSNYDVYSSEVNYLDGYADSIELAYSRVFSKVRGALGLGYSDFNYNDQSTSISSYTSFPVSASFSYEIKSWLFVVYGLYESRNFDDYEEGVGVDDRLDEKLDLLFQTNYILNRNVFLFLETSYTENASSDEDTFSYTQSLILLGISASI